MLNSNGCSRMLMKKLIMSKSELHFKGYIAASSPYLELNLQWLPSRPDGSTRSNELQAQLVKNLKGKSCDTQLHPNTIDPMFQKLEMRKCS
ncbi:hypothetical protein Tco_0140035 [Tanacetum coccineum]